MKIDPTKASQVLLPRTAAALHLRAAQNAAPRAVATVLHDNTSRTVRIAFDVRLAALPALRSAVGKLTDDVGTYLMEPHAYAAEHAATLAAEGVAALRAAVCAEVAGGDPHFSVR